LKYGSKYVPSFSFLAGTLSTGKQALQKSWQKSCIKSHYCERSRRYATASSIPAASRKDDSWIYTAGYKFYQVGLIALFAFGLSAKLMPKALELLCLHYNTFVTPQVFQMTAEGTVGAHLLVGYKTVKTG
jgi:hypothetical protein